MAFAEPPRWARTEDPERSGPPQSGLLPPYLSAREFDRAIAGHVMNVDRPAEAGVGYLSWSDRLPTLPNRAAGR